MVLGDIVIKCTGDKIDADVILINLVSSNFMIDQSNFTGETKHAYKMSEPIIKDKVDLAEMLNIVFSINKRSIWLRKGNCCP